jgi:hypothetical protein
VPSATTGSVSTLANGDRVVTVSGQWQWQWTTHKSDCNNDKRAVGVAIDWNDPTAPGNHVDTVNGVSVDVGTPSDDVVHRAMPGTDSTSISSWRGGCGTFSSSAGTTPAPGAP